MRALVVAIFIGMISYPASACGVAGIDVFGTCKVADTAKDSIDAIVRQVKESQERFVRTTPGIADRAALEDFASSDPQVRAALADRYRNLLAAAEALDKADKKIPIPNYKLVGSFEFDESKTFHITLFRAVDGPLLRQPVLLPTVQSN
ncbi:hypothetical protein ACQR1Y_23735 [Bradyrhizobium sp. HKCCYLRH3099]|uniref:hypothetical protein n=1 Tax=unclassified Bradyrhizobium TaxID=2631580 RepID=UPI003EBE1E24